MNRFWIQQENYNRLQFPAVFKKVSVNNEFNGKDLFLDNIF